MSDPAEGGPGHVVIVKGDGQPGSFVFSTGDCKAASGKELLEKNELDALRGADVRTRDAVAKALDELMAKGLVMTPGSMSLLHAGEGAHVTVERKKTETR